MLPPKKAPRQQSLFFGLSLDPKHRLYILAHQIDWDMFEKNFAPLYCPNNGRPAKPILLMVGLLILKHLRNLSDESLVEQLPADECGNWKENYRTTKR